MNLFKAAQIHNVIYFYKIMKYERRFLLFCLCFFLVASNPPHLAAQAAVSPGQFTIARLKYQGGGDWYSNPSSLPNLLEFLRHSTNVDAAPREVRVELTDENLFSYPYLYMNGHGNVRFSDEEARILYRYLTTGGFLHADDNYGMDQSFRREMKKVFPEQDLIELPFTHGIYRILFDFPNGIPKIHEHDGGPGHGYGIFHEGRLVVYYSFNTDLGDGWEDPEVHNDPEQKRQEALRMGANIVLWALSH